MNGRAGVCAGLGLALLLASRPSAADLADDIALLEQAWRPLGAVHHLPPRFAERSSPSIVFPPPELFRKAGAPCLSVAVLGPSSTHFIVRAVGGSALTRVDDDWPEASIAGLVHLTRCGAERVRLSALVVEMRSARAVLEVVAVESWDALPPAVRALPHRDPGPIARFNAPEAARRPPAIAERLSAAELRARRAGSGEVTRDVRRTSPRGSARIGRAIEPGCERIELLAELASDGNAGQDLSVVPELPDGVALADIEYGDGLTAVVSLCAAIAAPINLNVLGAPTEAALWNVTSRTPLPEGLSASFGPIGQARMAALLQRHRVRLSGTLVDQAFGVQGPTMMPIPVEPGACYLGILTPVRGQATSLALAVALGSTSAQNHGGLSGDGTLISFCARERRVALVEAESRGDGLVWLFALYQNGRVRVGEELAH